MKNSALSYANSIETRHNMSADSRSKGEHIHGMPDVAECGLGKCAVASDVRSTDTHDSKGTSPGKGKGSEKFI